VIKVERAVLLLLPPLSERTYQRRSNQRNGACVCLCSWIFAPTADLGVFSIQYFFTETVFERRLIYRSGMKTVARMESEIDGRWIAFKKPSHFTLLCQRFQL
jgi:hypothetical protein